jgi:probable phosphoglycerate mutase
MKLYFARHAESEANIKHIISNRGLLHPLSERGRTQAEDLAKKLKNANLSGIFCSPIQRAVETAQIVGVSLGIPIAKADALLEFDAGVMEGRSDDEAWFELGHAMRMWLEVRDPNYRIIDGESLIEVQDRFFEFITHLVKIGGDESFLLISHGGTFRLTIPFLLKNLPPNLYEDRFFDYTDYTLAEVVDGQLICREWCGKKID